MKQNLDESLAFSLIQDDLPFRVQRRVGLIPGRDWAPFAGRSFSPCSPGCPSSYGLRI